jgi:hypothetical protein
MKIGTGMCHVTEETAQSVIIIITLSIIIIFIFIIIIITIVTNTIINAIQASACCKWHTQRASIHVTEQACWGKSTNLDILTNCRAAMSGMVKLDKTESRR